MTNRYRSSHKIVVIADDLTGANDTGVQFAKQGLKTIVLMRVPGSLSELDEDVLVVDTQSRALSPAEAYQKVTETALLFKNRDQFQTLYKKIDSTLRGNLGTEIDAIMDVCGLELAIVAPAFPRNGRITVGGCHFLGNAPLEATEIARDPLCPVSESHIPTLLAKQTKRRVGHIGIKSIIAGTEGILDAMRQLVCGRPEDPCLRCVAGGTSEDDRTGRRTARETDSVGRISRIGGIRAIGTGSGRRIGRQKTGRGYRRQRKQRNTRPGSHAEAADRHSVY